MLRLSPDFKRPRNYNKYLLKILFFRQKIVNLSSKICILSKSQLNTLKLIPYPNKAVASIIGALGRGACALATISPTTIYATTTI